MIVIKDRNQLKNQGNSFLIYSLTGIGKTMSTLLYAPTPIFWLITETTRDIKQTIDMVEDISDRKFGKDINLGVYETFFPALDYMCHTENFTEFKTVTLDSLSYLLNVLLPDELTEERIEAKKIEDAGFKDKMKLTQSGFGQMNQAIFRLCGAMGRLTKQNKHFIALCGENENPKYDVELFAGPAFIGKQIPDNLPFMFDYVGRLINEIAADENGNKFPVYPATVDFRASQGFLAKWTGKGDKRRGPVDKFLQRFK